MTPGPVRPPMPSGPGAPPAPGAPQNPLLQRILSGMLPQMLGGVSQNLQDPDKDLEITIKQTSRKGVLQSMNRPPSPGGGQ